MLLAAAQFLAPRWSPTVLAAVHEDVAVQLARLGPRPSRLARRQAVVAALEAQVRRDVRARLRLRHRRAAMHAWRCWSAEFVLGCGSTDQYVDRAGQELADYLSALEIRWSQIVADLAPVPATTR